MDVSSLFTLILTCKMAYRIYKGRWEDQNHRDYSLKSKGLPQWALSCLLLIESKTEAGETNLFSGNKCYIEEGTSSLHLERHLPSTCCIPAGENASLRFIQLDLWSAHVWKLHGMLQTQSPDAESLLQRRLTSLWLMQRSRVLACCPLTGFQKH